MTAARASGILLHIVSLPSRYGIGDLGPAAYAFADFLAASKQGLWQILPVGPTDPACGNSPYSSSSAFAGSHLMISPDLLLDDGLLTEAEVDQEAVPVRDRAHYSAATAGKERLLDRAFQRWQRRQDKAEYDQFCAQHAGWLGEFADFAAIKAAHGGQDWGCWPKELRFRNAASLESARGRLAERIEREKFCQFLFFKQWTCLKRYCNDRGISMVGDLPIYVSYDSADAWSNPDLFKLDSEGRPAAVAGVPPDYFSETGQLWGNPVYRWDALKQTRYQWWVARMGHALGMFDTVRVDHFRGFVAFWEVPAGEPTAVNGKWVDAPADDLLEVLAGAFPDLPVIAEDLGVITPEVKAVMERFGLPGMKVLQFAFGDDDPHQPYLPHNFGPNCFVYTGTHDNNTLMGWFGTEARPDERRRLLRYLGADVAPERLHWEVMRLAMMSVARSAVFPLQDILGLGADSRMNLPSALDGNWSWRILPDHLTAAVRDDLGQMTETYGRSAAGGRAKA
jgi:4-alpha-glucanotransferase